MAKYIDADAILNSFGCDPAYYGEKEQYLAETLEFVPASDVAEVVHGRWIDGAGDFTCGVYDVECSECGANIKFSGCDEDFNFCPNCGARMDGDNHDRPNNSVSVVGRFLPRNRKQRKCGRGRNAREHGEIK